MLLKIVHDKWQFLHIFVLLLGLLQENDSNWIPSAKLIQAAKLQHILFDVFGASAIFVTIVDFLFLDSGTLMFFDLLIYFCRYNYTSK